MKNEGLQKVLRLKRIFYILTFFGVNILFFQNCNNNNTQFTPANPAYFEGSESNPFIAEGKLGDQANMPALKLVFVLDNSYTMSLANIKLSEAFSKIFSGAASESLDLTNTDVYLLSTAQNLQKDSKAISRSSLALKYAIENNSEAIKKVSYNDISEMRRFPISGRIPGDILGYDAKIVEHKELGTSDILFREVPVLDFIENKDNQLSILNKINKPARGSLKELNEKFKLKLEILNSNNNEIDSTSAISESVSEESGMCALARIMKHSPDYFTGSDMVSFILVSDEDDNFLDGKNCIESIKQTKDPKTYVTGICQSQESNLKYKLDTSIITYQYEMGATCRVSKNNQFNLLYKYKEFAYKINYYVMKTIFKDNKPIQVVDTVQKTLFVDNNPIGKCDKTNLQNILPSTTIFTDNQYPVSCASLAANEIPIEAEKNSDAVLGSKISFTDSRLLTLNIIKSELSSVGSVCNIKLINFLISVDPKLKSGERQLGSCKIGGHFYNGGNTNNTTSNVLDSNKCNDLNVSCNSFANQVCTNTFIAAPATGYSTNRTVTYQQKDVTCATKCSDTDLCKSFPNLRVEEYISTRVVNAKIRNCSARNSVAAESSLPTTGSYVGAFNCDTPCSQTSYCPNEKVKTVQEYLLAQVQASLAKASLNSCSVNAKTTDVAFGPIEQGSNYCQKGTAIVDSDTTKNTKFIDNIEYVTGNNQDGTVAKDLITYIKDTTNSIFQNEKPFFTFFVLQPLDLANEQQSIGRNYNRLADFVSGTKSSILDEDYSDSMVKLSKKIKEKISRSIYFADVKNYHMIRKVWLNNIQLNKDEHWTAQAGTVTFKKKVELNPTDQVKIEFY